MARLSKEELADRTRYQFKTEEVEIPELGGSVQVKTLSVKERDDLPDLVKVKLDGDGKAVTDDNGNPLTEADSSVEKLAGVWAQVVSDPKLTAKEAEAILGDLPAPALDRVIEKFGELLSTKEEVAAETRTDFRPEEDGS